LCFFVFRQLPADPHFMPKSVDSVGLTMVRYQQLP
jgi:hypothetical protein